MLSVEWPIAAAAADPGVERVRPTRRDRLSVVRRDLFLDDRARLTERERALMSAMLRNLVEQVADEIRIGLPHDVLAHAEADRAAVVVRLWSGGALDRPALIALLHRRAEEQRIAEACREAQVRAAEGTVERLVGDGDPGIASAAMALAVARGRRRDRFGRIGLECDDVRADDLRWLAFQIAAAMRAGIASPSVSIDEALAAAAERLLDRHDDRRCLDVRVLALAEALVAVCGADDQLFAAFAGEGDAAMATALCAVRAHIAQESAWTLLAECDAREAMLLARLAEFARPAAAAMVAALAGPLQWGEPGVAIAHFDGISAGEIDAAARWWGLPPAYRDALVADGGACGCARA